MKRRLLGFGTRAAHRSLTVVNRLLLDRAFFLVLAVGWLALVLITAVVLSAGGAGALVTAALGLVGMVLMQAHRQHHLVVAEFRQLRERVESTRRASSASAAATAEVLSHAKLSALSLGRLSEELSRLSAGTHQTVAREVGRVYRDLEALENLYATLTVARPVPSMRGRGLSPAGILTLVELLRSGKPRLVVLCGDGVAALWAALASRDFGISARIVSVEHDARAAGATRDLLTDHGVAERVDVRYAALEPVELYGEMCEWYGTDAFADLHHIDLLFLGGSTPEHDLRFPALPVLADKVADAGQIVLDEADALDDLAVVDRWLSLPGLTCERRTERGVSVLSVSRPEVGAPSASGSCADGEERLPVSEDRVG